MSSTALWKDCFDAALDLAVARPPRCTLSMRVYTSSSTSSTTKSPASPLPVYVMLHGAGQTSLSWALMAAELRQLTPCVVAAVDLRGHGETRVIVKEREKDGTDVDVDVEVDDDEEADLSAATLTGDTVAMLGVLLERLGCPGAPVVLVGHSMGGAIAVRAAAALALATETTPGETKAPNVVGLVVVDIVEGTAIASIAHSKRIVDARPTTFSSPTEAVRWALDTGFSRNPAAARRAIPSQLVTVVPPGAEEAGADDSVPLPAATCATPMAPPAPPEQERRRRPYLWSWRTDLGRSVRHWRGWYEGLSSLFVQVTASPPMADPTPVSAARGAGAAEATPRKKKSRRVLQKMLVLAGMDRLDTDLMVGQMQGKFQLVVLRGCGHGVHEDRPGLLAGKLRDFAERIGIAGAGAGRGGNNKTRRR